MGKRQMQDMSGRMTTTIKGYQRKYKRAKPKNKLREREINLTQSQIIYYHSPSIGSWVAM
jgi:hypothetical protein